MRVEPYTGLASLYNAIGLAAYSETLIPRLLEAAFISGWVGRTIVDVGCGTGEVVRYLAKQTYRVIGCDVSGAMLAVGSTRAQSEGLVVEWLQGTAQTLELATSVDMVLMLGGTLNVLGSLNEIDQSIQRAANALEPGKLLIFDMDTVRGLIAADTPMTQLVYNVPDQGLVTAESRINFEQLIRSTEYTIFTHKLSESTWTTYTEVHVQRAFPFAAIRRYLTKAGLTLIGVYDPNTMNPAEPEDCARILVIAQKPGTAVD